MFITYFLQQIGLFLPCPCLLNTAILLRTLYYTRNSDQSSDLKDEPARGSKYRHNKKYRVFKKNFGQSVCKETKTSKFFMEDFSEFFTL